MWDCIPKRYITIVLCCLGMFVIHAMRVNIAVTVVTILDKAPHMKVGSIQAIAHLPNRFWDSAMVGYLHSVFFIGYFVTQLPGGYLATKCASHRIFGGCIFLSSCLNFLLPLCIESLGYGYTCTVRFLQGLSEGLLFPSSYAVLRHWTTPEERSRSGSAVLTGVYTGAVVGLPLSGYITHYYGWQYSYYASGGMCLFWFIIWLVFAYERPSSYPSITEEELNFIESKQGETAIVYQDDKVPWKHVFLSMPVNALNVCNFARSWVFFLLLTNEPTYLNSFGYNLKENGILSAMPHLLMAIISAVSGFVADALMNDTKLTPTQVRKIFTCIGFGVEALCCYMLFFANSGTMALVFLTIGVGISGFTISGWQINHLDLAPRYASVLVALTTAWGTTAGIISPLIAGHITTDQSIRSWQYVLLISAVILTIAVIFYAIFGSAEKQLWAEPSTKLQLVQNPDNGVQKPYGTLSHEQVQPPSETKEELGAAQSDKSSLIPEAPDAETESKSAPDIGTSETET